MGKCLSSGNHIYEKVRVKTDGKTKPEDKKKKHKNKNQPQPDLKHMDVSTIHLASDIYTTTDGWFHNGDNAEHPHAITLYEIESFTPRFGSKSNGSLVSPLAMTRITSDQIQLIHLYVLEIQSILSNEYKDTEYGLEFAVIPNKIHHIISSYW